MITKKIISTIISLALILFLSTSCTETQNAEDMLLDITKEIDNLPQGILYLKRAPEGSDAYMGDSLIRSLYHENALEYEFMLLEDFAVYISANKPCEIAVYKCYSSSDTDVIAAMCLRRIDTLRILLEGTPYKDIPKNAKIDIDGRFVKVVML